MRRLNACAMFAVILLFSATDPFASSSVMPVENWRKVAEEKQIFHETSGAGLIWRLHIDPAQHDGVGATLSVFRKDGSEELFWKGWNLYTDKGQYALLVDGSFYVQPKAGSLTDNMVTLGAMLEFIRSNGGKIGKISNISICLMNEEHGVLILADGKKACYISDFTK